MTEWCSCNKLREAEEKAAKWDAIVRCKECEFFNRFVTALGKKNYCERLDAFIGTDGFCSWGERRDA